MSQKNTPEKYMARIRRLFENEAALRLPADKLADRMRVRRGDKPAFLTALSRLESSGGIQRDTRGRYHLPLRGSRRPGRHSETAVGRVSALHPHFAFVTLEEGQGDCFIPGEGLLDALPGDRVEVLLGPTDRRGPQGRIRRVLEPGEQRYTGQLYMENRRLFVRPGSGFRYDLPVRQRTAEDCKSGDLVRFSVSAARAGGWMAAVEQRYGSGDSARVCADALIDQYGIPSAFSEEVLAEAESRAAIELNDKDWEYREDLRSLPLFTIDGADAKDLDDAVSLRQLEDGYELGVHIADVSYYVTPGSAVDREALERTTSVYFADRVIPMLPPALSNGACSLNAGEDKRAFSALIQLSTDGKVRRCRLVKSVIRSAVRGVYSEVNALLDGTADEDVLRKYAPVTEQLTAMAELAALLERNALRRGVMQMAGVESRIYLDENGMAVDVRARTGGRSERMIEQFMITANTAVAALAKQHKLPFVYRTHGQPNEERLGLLFDLARAKGLPVPPSATGVSQAALQKLLGAAAETPYARLVSEQLLRSMAKARYETELQGHYGLSLQDYCHFTSPIRRYPDLMIHRILSRWLAGEGAGKLHGRLGEAASRAAEASSAGEIRAMNAERACEACYKAEYIRRFLGDVFDGMIVSVSETGLFVELPNTVCGMVPVESLPEFTLRFDGLATLYDNLGHAAYTVGQPVRVQVVAAEVATGRIRFELE